MPELVMKLLVKFVISFSRTWKGPCVWLEDKTQKSLSVFGGVLKERAVRLCNSWAYTEPVSEEKDRKV